MLEEQAVWARPDPQASVITSRRILLAEDDPEMCSLLAEALQEDGYEVVTAANGSQLMSQITSLRGSISNGRFFDVDLIISDIRMPGVSGLKVLTELRKRDRETPVILITAFGDQQTHMDAHRQGVAAVFDKPFDFDAFRVFVRQLVPPRTDESADLFP